MLELRGIGTRLDGRWVIRDVDLSCAPGEAVALVGGNGAGKTTVLRAVAGILPLDAGSIFFGGRPLRGSVRRQIGFVPEAADPPGFLSAQELIALTASLRRAEVPLEAERRRLYPAELERARIATLSLGERRRVCLAAALAGDPSLLILDEPENGLDLAGVDLLVELLRAACDRGAIVLLASHEPALRRALGCREVGLRGGRLAPSDQEAAESDG